VRRNSASASCTSRARTVGADCATCDHTEWQPDRDRSRYEQIVTDLVQPPTCNSAELGSAHVHQCYEKGRGDSLWTPPTASGKLPSAESYELPPADVCRKPDQWLVGTQGLRRVRDALDEEEATARKSGKILLYEVPGWRKLFRTRVFMSAKRFRHLAEVDGDLDYWALIDMRFQWIAPGSVLLHTSLALWSDLPWSLHHRSGVEPVREPGGLLPKTPLISSKITRSHGWPSGNSSTHLTGACCVFSAATTSPALSRGRSGYRL
jgi:hypothetical protein